MADRFRWLDAVLGDTADGLYVVDHGHRIIRWNDGARQLLGHTADEVLNRRCYEIVAGCARDGKPVCGPDCPVHGCMDQGELPKSMELQVRTKDGRHIWLRLLRWLAAGLSNSAIAARMGVSRFTVSSHLQHIMDKAVVHGRSEVVAFAFRHHLL